MTHMSSVSQGFPSISCKFQDVSGISMHLVIFPVTLNYHGMLLCLYFSATCYLNVTNGDCLHSFVGEGICGSLCHSHFN